MLYQPFQDLLDERRKSPEDIVRLSSFVEHLLRTCCRLVVAELCAKSRDGRFRGYTKYCVLFRKPTFHELLNVCGSLLLDLETGDIKKLRAVIGPRLVNSFTDTDLADIQQLRLVRNSVDHDHREPTKRELKDAWDISERLTEKNKVLSETLSINPQGECLYGVTNRNSYEFCKVTASYGSGIPFKLASMVLKCTTHRREFFCTMSEAVHAVHGNDRWSLTAIGKVKGFFVRTHYPNDLLPAFSDIPSKFISRDTFTDNYEECELLIQDEPKHIDEELERSGVERDKALSVIDDILVTTRDGILLVEADMGSGKSWLLRSSYFQRRDNECYLGTNLKPFFYFNRKTDSQGTTVREIWSSVFARVIRDLHLKETLIYETSSQLLADRVLKALDEKYGGKAPGLLLYIDALDEILDDTRLKLARSIRNIVDRSEGQIRVVVSSREDEEVQRMLKPDSTLSNDLLVDEDEMFSYVQTELGLVSWLDENKLHSIAKSIADKTKGNFLYTSHLICRVKDHKISDSTEIDQLPEKLFEFFKEDIDLKVFQPLHSAKQDEISKHLKDFLTVLYILSSSVSLRFLSQVLNVGVGDLNDIFLPRLREYLSIENRFSNQSKPSFMISIRASGFIEFLEEYEPVIDRVKDVATSIIKICISTKLHDDDLKMFVSTFERVNKFVDSSLYFELLKNRGFVDAFIRSKSDEDSLFLQHPTSKIFPIEENFNQRRHWVVACIRFLLNKKENSVFNHMGEWRYWCHWFIGRPESMTGLSQVQLQTWPLFLFRANSELPDNRLISDKTFYKDVMRIGIYRGNNDWGVSNYVRDHLVLGQSGALDSWRVRVSLEGLTSDMIIELISVEDCIYELLDNDCTDIDYLAALLNNWWLELLVFIVRRETANSNGSPKFIAKSIHRVVSFLVTKGHTGLVVLGAYCPNLYFLIDRLPDEDCSRVVKELSIYIEQIEHALCNYIQEQSEIVTRFDREYASQYLEGNNDSFDEDLNKCFTNLYEALEKDLPDGDIRKLLNKCNTKEIPKDGHHLHDYLVSCQFFIDPNDDPDEHDKDSKYYKVDDFPWSIFNRFIGCMNYLGVCVQTDEKIMHSIRSLRVNSESLFGHLYLFRVFFTDFNNYWELINGELNGSSLYAMPFHFYRFGCILPTKPIQRKPLIGEITTQINLFLEEIEKHQDDIEWIVEYFYLQEGESRTRLDLAVSRLWSEYSLNLDQQKEVLSNYDRSDDRFTLMATWLLDPTNPEHRQSFGDYFVEWIGRIIKTKVENRHNETTNADEELEVDEDKRSDAIRDLVFGWLFLMINCWEQVPIAIGLIRSSTVPDRSYFPSRSDLLDTFITALIHLNPDKAKEGLQLFEKEFPEYCKKSNLPDCEASYNQVFEMTEEELISFLDKYYECQSGAVTGGDLLKEWENTASILSELLIESNLDDLDLEVVLEKLGSSLL